MTSSRVPLIVVDDRKDPSTVDSSSSSSPSSAPPSNRHSNPNQRHNHNTPTSASSQSSSSLHHQHPTPISHPNPDGQSHDNNPINTSSTAKYPTPLSHSHSKSREDDGNGHTNITVMPNTKTVIATTTNNNDIAPETTTPQISVHSPRSRITSRSSSDIGIPAASMPNLSLHQMGCTPRVVSESAGTGAGGEKGGGCGENYLGVYCSPRTTRRSVDLDLKETVPGQYDWMETLETSSNSLKVLTASSRVGSALSLNSECTTRSIGLLSNDSDSEEFSQSDNKPQGEGKLRRYMSYPEEAHIPESNARPSQSLSNLKSANHSPCMARADRYLQRQSLDYADLAESSRTIVSENEKKDEDHEKVGVGGGGAGDDSVGKPASLTRSEEKKPEIADMKDDGQGNSSFGNGKKDHLEKVIVVDSEVVEGGGSRVDEVEEGGGGKTRRDPRIGSNVMVSNTSPRGSNVSVWKKGGVIGSVKKANNSNMLCYKCDTNSPSREGRIRQWLQDMDTTQTSQTDEPIP